MKYFIQVALATLPFFVFLIAHSTGGTIPIATVDIIFKKVNIIFYGIVCIISIFGYANMVNREMKKEVKKICYTLAQCIFLLTAVTAFAYGYVTSEWIDIVKGMPATKDQAAVVDIFKSVVDFMSALDLCLVAQYIAATHFNRWLLPFGIKFPTPEPIGEIMISEGIITRDQLEKALEKQLQRVETERNRNHERA